MYQKEATTLQFPYKNLLSFKIPINNNFVHSLNESKGEMKKETKARR